MTTRTPPSEGLGGAASGDGRAVRIPEWRRSSRRRHARPYGQPLDTAAFIQPRIEPEIAFLLGQDLAGPATVASVLATTEAVFAAVDVLDSRYQDYRFTLPDVVADNAPAGAFLLGPQARSPADLVDLRLLGCVLRVGGDVVATAAGAATLGHPATAEFDGLGTVEVHGAGRRAPVRRRATRRLGGPYTKQPLHRSGFLNTE